MAWVIDASVAVAWLFEDERSATRPSMDEVRTEQLVVPSLWWFEVRSALILGERRGRATAEDTAASLNDLSRLRIEYAPFPNEQVALELARRHRLTLYDAAYLELALRERVPLATLDTALRRAARAEKVALI